MRLRVLFAGTFFLVLAAGVLYGIHENWLLTDLVKLGHATAAASLRRVSTTGSVENWKACLQLASDWGWRTLPAA